MATLWRDHGTLAPRLTNGINALPQGNSATEVMGIGELKVIARELVTKVRASVAID
ncbi:hypothetical protein AB1L30_04890 [Bremerella sp. JC817]|uniref:hypothetical protein n=1 Tax=Bremerella sp. JC817 TaxID=3231756 RepID=UPI003459FEBE